MAFEIRNIGTEDNRAMVVVDEEPTGAFQQITQGELASQVAVAKRFPRSIAKFKAKLNEMVGLNKEVAESSYYLVPRAGKRLTGPSIRMAEMAVSAFGNCRVAGRILSTDHDSVTLEGVAIDMENNTAWYVQTVRRLLDSKGKRYSDDMVITTTNAGISIAVRNAALRMIPRALIDSALTTARQVVAGNIKDFSAARKETLKACEAVGISKERVFGFLDVGGEEDITVNHLLDLKGAMNAIQDGQATVTEVFPEVTGNGGTEKAGRRSFGRKKAVEPPAADKPTPPVESGVVTAPDPNREPKMSAPQQSIFQRKTEELCGTRSKAVVAVQLAIDALVKEQTLPVTVRGWQDLEDAHVEFVLAALTRLEKKE